MARGVGSKLDKEKQLLDIKDVINNVEELFEEQDPWGRATTGCLLHDLQAGGKKGVLGYPYGWMVNFVGASSSGKTILAHEMIGNEHNKNIGLIPKYVPTEFGDSFDTIGTYGYDANMDWKDVPKTVQEFDAFHTHFLKTLRAPKGGKKDDTPPAIVVMDSLDSLRSNQTIDMHEERVKQFEKNEQVEDKGSFQMEKAKFLSTHFFPNCASEIREKKSILAIISQVRDNTDPMSFEKEARAGGRAMDFYCHTVQWLYATDKVFSSVKDKKAGRSCGGIMRVKNKKSKTPRPGRIIHILFYYNFGIDDVGTSLLYIFDLLSDGGKMTQLNPEIVWEGETVKFNTLRNSIYEDDKSGDGAMRKKLDQMVIDKWESAEDSCLKLTPGAGAFKKYGN